MSHLKKTNIFYTQVEDRCQEEEEEEEYYIIIDDDDDDDLQIDPPFTQALVGFL